ncbi:Nucleotide-binding universal stress protein, UspA family [Sinomicrobium oceani]|uniref:Nucleotide-binding universal stress protein, UspA family n=1 Tax=Sinomicrobium oceani TaxID=1150368 RepID=A0A1K1QFY0_9FLAO|nr:universal stress protein [Sinomicrobium oceani]SFW58856.1 Nucleotide-binding universal stress protein, UspA family [Sinomicrobium oceani]
MKTIVVATDFSVEAENALVYAAKMAAEHSYRLVLFSLYNISIHALNARLSDDTIQMLIEAKNKELDMLKVNVKATYAVEVETHLASGDFYEEVKYCIGQYGADLLVMGMAEKSVEQDLMGNTTTTAIHHLNTPILAIPEGARYKGIYHMMFACDIVKGVQKSVFEKVHAFASDFAAIVEVFHVSNKIEELQKAAPPTAMIDDELKDITHYYKNIESKKILEAIREEMASTKTDVLIMVPYKYGFWKSLVHRSKTRMMASGSHVPLLSLPVEV